MGNLTGSRTGAVQPTRGAGADRARGRVRPRHDHLPPGLPPCDVRRPTAARPAASARLEHGR
jgi:hypothetical protein